MTVIRWAVRFVCFIAGMVLLAALAVQIQQRALRWRAQRLSAEMSEIRLYQSTWPDAQRLMKRWGAWGQYEGRCIAESCAYTIRLTDVSFGNQITPAPTWELWLLSHDHYNIYHWLGGRGAVFYASFTVHNGTIWRKGAGVGVVVSTRKERRDDEYDKTLFIRAESRQRLHATIDDPFWILGSDNQLAQHPYYKADRPGGCKINCQMAVISYSTRTPPAEINRLTSYDFSCFTRFQPCSELGDGLPAAKEWHLYKKDEAESGLPKPSTAPGKPCNIPIWALARDANYILAIQALSTKSVVEYENAREVSNVRVTASLKDSSPWHPGAIIPAYPFAGNSYASPPEAADYLVPGTHYIIFPIGDDRRDQLVTEDSPLRLGRCGVQQDTLETRREIVRGLGTC